jgi:hypothetical protein
MSRNKKTDKNDEIKIFSLKYRYIAKPKIHKD